MKKGTIMSIALRCILFLIICTTIFWIVARQQKQQPSYLKMVSSYLKMVSNASEFPSEDYYDCIIYSRADADLLARSGLSWDIKHLNESYQWPVRDIVFTSTAGHQYPLPLTLRLTYPKSQSLYLVIPPSGCILFKEVILYHSDVMVVSNDVIKDYPLLKKKKKSRPPQCPAPPPSPPPPPPPVIPFDYLMLSETWPATFCIDKKCGKQPSRFTIHGLWPQNYSGPSPRYCHTEKKSNWGKFASLEKLHSDWPCLTAPDQHSRLVGSLRFWDREWWAHGSCSMMDFDTYFNRALDIYAIHDLMDYLRKEGISPSFKLINSIDIVDAIANHIGFEPQLKCMRYKKAWYLLEIRLCLDKGGGSLFEDCSPTLSTCPEQVYFP